MNILKVITQRQLIKELPERWKHQYRGDTKEWITEEDYKKHINNKTTFQIYNELKQLDLNIATPDDIYDIIGNASWTNIKCDICMTNVESAIIFSYYDEYQVIICKHCIYYMEYLLK